MTEQAFDDQCTGANPRYPLMSEIRQMYMNAYYGRTFTEADTPDGTQLAAGHEGGAGKPSARGQKRAAGKA